MAEFHFLRPAWLLALVPLFFVWWRLFSRKDALAQMKQVFDPHLMEHLLTGQRRERAFRPVNLLLVFWLVLVLALAGPAWRLEPSPFAGEEAGLVVVLKAGETMNARDVQPSRLERAKHKLRDLLERRAAAATGLMLYSGSAHLVMPLTRDHRILSILLEDLTPELMPRKGDALGDAIHRAEGLLSRAGVPGSVLVLADTVSPSEAASLSRGTASYPVQFLSLLPPGAPLDPGLEEAAKRLRAPVTRLAADSADVERVARLARSERSSLVGASGQERWRDGGYALVPLIALIGLAWSRKGWCVR